MAEIADPAPGTGHPTLQVTQHRRPSTLFSPRYGPSDAIMKAWAALAFAGAVSPALVTGRGYVVDPQPTWVVTTFNDKNAPAAFYNVPSSEMNRNPLDIYPDLRSIVDKDSYNPGITTLAVNATKKCGLTSATGTVRNISSSIQFGNDAPHPGPCEVWVDDTRTTVSRDCKTDFPSWKIPVDMTKCTQATCVVQFIWVDTQNKNKYDVYSTY